MAPVEVLMLSLTLLAYVVASFTQWSAFLWNDDRRQKLAARMLGFACGAHAVTFVLRWIAGAHPPVADTYELNLTGTLLTAVLLIALLRAGKVPRAVSIVVTPLVFLVLGYGALHRAEAVPLGPAYDSPWLIVHVVFAWLAFGSFAVAAGASGLLLLKEYAPQSRLAVRIPDASGLDQVSYRLIVLGFIHHAIMLGSGSIWARNLWGRYWSWDPLETWSLLTFLLYAFYLHARAFLGWKMKKAAWLAAFGLIVLSISFWGVAWFGPTLHPGP